MATMVASQRTHGATTEASFSAETTGDPVNLGDPKCDNVLDTSGVNSCHGFARGAATVELSTLPAPAA